MTKQFSENIFTGVVAGLVILTLTPVADWLSKAIGPTLESLVLFVIAILIVAFYIRVIHYSGILGAGAEPETSPKRQDYDALRERLAGDNLVVRLYAEWLKRFLDAVERFCDDADMKGQRAFRLEKPAPLWTAPAFDRCLLLALIYPIATIFVIWAVSGHVGPAETALGLKLNVPGWSRGLAAAAIGFTSFTLWRGARARGWKSRVSIAGAMAAAGAVAFAFAFAGSANAAFSGAALANEALDKLTETPIAAAATFAVASLPLSLWLSLSLSLRPLLAQ